MPTESAPTDPVQLGHQAKRLLDDPVLTLAFDRVETKLAATWAGSDAGDAEGRERVHAELRALRRVKSELHVMVSPAQVFEAQAKAPARR